MVRLLQAYLIRGAKEIVQNNQLPSFLGIYQKLVASRINDHFGLELLGIIFQHVSMESLSPFLKNILNILLVRLQNQKTPKLIYNILRFVMTVFVTTSGTQMLIDCFESIQRG